MGHLTILNNLLDAKERLQKWVDSAGNDDHGRGPGGGGKEGGSSSSPKIGLSPKQMATVPTGATLIYNDGRPGHQDVAATVLSNNARPGVMVVSFEDRADTTTISHNDPSWTKFLRIKG